MVVNLDRQALSLPFSYEILRSPRRRSISIEVRSARVSVRAPMSVAEKELHHFVREKSDWITRKILEQQQHLQQIPQRCYESGATLPYLGRQLVLSVESGKSANIELLQEADEEFLRVCWSHRRRADENTQVRQLVCHWYQRQALAVLTQKTDTLVAKMGLHYRGVKVKATRSKWGHCTSRGAIQYNWHIILAPMGIVDYLVAHEVCHLQHPNHSSAFWQLVASVCPTFRADRAWLKAQGAQLIL